MENEVLENEVQGFDLTEFKASHSRARSRATGRAGIITIINSPENGNRIEFADELVEQLNHPVYVQFAFIDGKMAIGEELPNNDSTFRVSYTGKKGTTYSKDLVLEASEMLDLDFSDRVSITLHNVKYIKNADKTIAIISAY